MIFHWKTKLKVLLVFEFSQINFKVLGEIYLKVRISSQNDDNSPQISRNSPQSANFTSNWNFFIKARKNQPNLPLFRVICFLLHNLENSLASHCTVFWISINGDCFFKWTNIILPVNVDPGTALLSDLPYCATLTSYDCTNHVTRDENSERKVSLTSWAAGYIAILRAVVALSATLLRWSWGWSSAWRLGFALE